ncbi:MAG: hypothetical protein IPP59_00515 [Betaproteobacteria bacterium]|nr:hypothetical protein [Candidatus Dechloromonas phosphorivorans]
MTQIVVKHYAQPNTRRHLWIGLVMAIVATAFGIEQTLHWFAAHPMAAKGLEASLLAGLATGLGAIPILFLRRPSERFDGTDARFGRRHDARGQSLSLLVPAVQTVAASDAPWMLGILTSSAFLAGVAMMQHMDRRLPHTHVESVESATARPTSRWWSLPSPCITCPRGLRSVLPQRPGQITA